MRQTTPKFAGLSVAMRQWGRLLDDGLCPSLLDNWYLIDTNAVLSMHNTVNNKPYNVKDPAIEISFAIWYLCIDTVLILMFN